MSVLSDKLKVLNERALEMNKELSSIGQQREKYKDCVIIYRDNRNRLQGGPPSKQIALIMGVDFTRGTITLRQISKSESITFALDVLDYEIIDKEELFERLG